MARRSARVFLAVTPLFDVDTHSAKHLRQFKYTSISVISSLLNSDEFVNKVNNHWQQFFSTPTFTIRQYCQLLLLNSNDLSYKLNCFKAHKSKNIFDYNCKLQLRSNFSLLFLSAKTVFYFLFLPFIWRSTGPCWGRNVGFSLSKVNFVYVSLFHCGHYIL